RRLYGHAAGLAAAALVAVFSPQLVLWSTLASGGYTLVVGWGSLTFAHLAATRRQPTLGRTALLGFLVGFGLYIYELYLVYVAILAGFALTSSFVWRAVLAPSRQARQARQERSAALPLAPGQIGRAALFLAGFLVGWAPKLWTTFFGGVATKLPAYGFASPEVMRANLELLVTRCVPALLGANPAGEPELLQWVGPMTALTTVLGVLVLLAWAAAWLQAVPGTGRDLLGALRRPPGEIGMEGLLVLLVPVTALLFVLSPNPTGVLSSRYLLPCLTSLPVLAGGWLVRLWRRGKLARLAAAALGLLLVGYPGAQIVLWHVGSGYLTADLRLPRSRDSLHEVFRELRRQGIRGGYGWYWIAYEANFLSGEEIVIAPSDGWDRYPAYTRFVDSLRRPAYLFEGGPETERVREAQFLERVRASDQPFEVRRVGQYAIYTSPRGERLLPASLVRGPNLLVQPRAEIAARGVDVLAGKVTPGRILEIPARLTNRGEDLWPAFGLDGSDHYRVALSYRWLDAAGQEVAGPPALRTPLPDDVLPGASVDLVARVQVPEAPGAYRLVLTMIQEDVLWFADAPEGGAAVFPVTVTAEAAAAAGGGG
ncbi:MAG TPA: hypothetical protein VEL74_23575, partial [Thermoanaerobaculia bacterium]|nr:hypothetical protein [Thermoanaerobaculia bacterium]